MKKCFLILIFLISQTSFGQYNMANQTFKNYHLAFGAGLGYSPASLFVKKKNKPSWMSSFRPNAKLELIFHPLFTLCVEGQVEHYAFSKQIRLERPLTTNFYNEYNTVATTIEGTTTNRCISFDLKKYSNGAGFFAPHGRYVLLGFSLNSAIHESKPFTLVYNDIANKSLAVDYSSSKRLQKAFGGIRLGLGRKHFMGKSLHSFIEFQAMYDIKFYGLQRWSFKWQNDDNPSQETPPWTGIYEKGALISSYYSMFQMTCIYGFAI